MSFSPISQKKIEEEFIDRLSKKVKNNTNIYLLVIGILLGSLFAGNFYYMSILSDDININHSEINELDDKLSEIKIEIIKSNTYLEIIANNKINQENVTDEQ